MTSSAPTTRAFTAALLLVLGVPLACPAPERDAGVLDSGAPHATDAGLADAGTLAWPIPTRAVCPGAYAATPEDAGDLEDDALVEVSGLTSSGYDQPVLWMHNDRGNPARLYAVGTDGAALARVNLTGTTVVDTEDIASARCPDGDGPCLWVADTGDNERARPTAQLHILREPTVDVAPDTVETLDASPHTVAFTYPGGPVDVEAMAVAPDGSAVWLFEKVDADRARLFRLQGPFDDGAQLAAELVTTVASPGRIDVAQGRVITGADLHPTGARLVVRVVSGLYEVRFGDGQSPADLDVTPWVLRVVGPTSEPQGEAVGYGPDGTSLFTVSEDPERLPGQPLHRFPCL